MVLIQIAPRFGRGQGAAPAAAARRLSSLVKPEARLPRISAALGAGLVVGRALDLEEKQKKWEQRNHHNKYSYLGNQIGDVVYSVSEKGAQWFVQQLDKIL